MSTLSSSADVLAPEWVPAPLYRMSLEKYEVADSSLSEDRKMARIYGSSGIPAYWIVNLVDRQVEVYTLPYLDGYHSRQDFAPGQEIPVVVDGVAVGRIRVADLLP